MNCSLLPVVDYLGDFAEAAPKKKKKSERYFEGAAAAIEGEAALAADKPKVSHPLVAAKA